jgi:hypothetical protein
LQTGSKATKFGLPISDGQAAQAIRAAQSSKWLNLTGLHMHLGSQIRQSQPYAEAITMLVALAEKENIFLLKYRRVVDWVWFIVPKMSMLMRAVGQYHHEHCAKGVSPARLAAAAPDP